MAPRIRTYAVTVPNGSTTAITTAHGEGETPSWLLVLSAGGAVAGLVTGDTRRVIGMTDGTRQYGWGAVLGDGDTTTADSVQQANNDRLANELERTGNTVTGRLDFTSFDATNFDLTPSDAFAADMLLLVVVGFGYTGAYVHAFNTAASAADITITGIPFQPDSMIGTITSSSLGTKPTLNTTGLGVANATSQWAVCSRRSETASDYTHGAFKTGSFLLCANTSPGAFLDDIALVNFTSDGCVLDRVVGSGMRGVGILFLQGGAPVVGTFAARTTPGSISVSTTGHTSGGLLLATRPAATASDTATVEPGEIIIGAAGSASNRRTLWMLDPNAEPLGAGSPTDPLGFHNNAAVYERRARTGADTTSQAALIDVQSIAAGTVTLDQTVADVASIIGYVSWGDPTSSLLGGGAYYRMLLEAHQ